MASKKATNQVEQTPILSKDDSSKAKTPVKKVIKKSRRYTSLDEFAVVNNLRPEVKAGFKAWLNNKLFHDDNEWVQLFKDYQNRTL